MSINVSFSRIYEFSAAHRLHSPTLNEAENRRVYDKCNNPRGHGHDYIAEISVKGNPDPLTGMIIPLPKLDRIVLELLEKLDHKHLDNEVGYFASNHTTGEIIIQYLWRELSGRIPDNMLHHIRLWETNNNYFEIGEED